MTNNFSSFRPARELGATPICVNDCMVRSAHRHVKRLLRICRREGQGSMAALTNPHVHTMRPKMPFASWSTKKTGVAHLDKGSFCVPIFRNLPSAIKCSMWKSTLSPSEGNNGIGRLAVGFSIPLLSESNNLISHHRRSTSLHQEAIWINCKHQVKMPSLFWCCSAHLICHKLSQLTDVIRNESLSTQIAPRCNSARFRAISSFRARKSSSWRCFLPFTL